MLRSTAQLNELLHQAQAGNREALGDLLEAARGYLQLMAQRELGGQLQARLGGSDVVQNTYLSAIRNFEDFQGDNIARFLAWLNLIHQRNLKDAIRAHAGVGIRDVGREVPQPVDSQSYDPPATTSSPSQRLMINEECLQLATMLQALKKDQREALRLRHLEGYSLADVADTMNKSQAAVAGLLVRGLQKLRRLMAEMH